MKAFLLAAGLGTRLKPLTDKTPKCLVPVCSKPLLQWWLELFEKHGINDILINLYHHSEKVEEFVAEYEGNVKINLFWEEELLGSGGTLLANKGFVENEEDFLIAYADNLTNYNLSKLIAFHRLNDRLLSMALFETDRPKEKGIVELDNNKTIISFTEKPANPKSNLANAGIYVASPQIINYLPNDTISDIGYDLLPKLIGKMSGWEATGYLKDIGTIEHYQQAQNEWKKIIGENKK